MKLKHSAVLITGGTKRLGLEMVKKSLAMGLDVVINFRSDRTETVRWLSRNSRFKSRVAFVQQDLVAEPAAIVEAALAAAPRLVGLVNNAAVFTPGNLDDLPHFHATLATNAFAPLALCQRFAARLASGWIINITDARNRPINLRWQNYRLSKLFLEEITSQLALRYAPHFRVNALAPGLILAAPGSEKEFKRLAASSPLKRATSIASFLNGFEFLVKNEDVTGAVIHVDCGWHLQA